MANRTESCYDNSKIPCKIYLGTGKPLVKKVRVLNDDGSVKFVIKSANEFKKIRKALRSQKRKAFKESCK